MSKGFNEQEKKAIKASLLEQGKLLFGKFGFKKTSISKLTQHVGIAQGTFYTFFSSKEALYFAILEVEEKAMQEQFFAIDILKDNDPKKTLKYMLQKMINMMETNPFIRELYFGSNMEDMVKKLSSESLEEHFNNDADSMLTLIEKWEEQGVILEQNPEVIAGMLRSLFILALHEKEIGVTVYREVINLQIDLIVRALIK